MFKSSQKKQKNSKIVPPKRYLASFDKKIIVFLLILFGNVWIWRMFLDQPVVFIASVTLSYFLYDLVIFKHKNIKVAVALLTLILFFQWWTTKPFSLTNLSNDDIRIKDMRLKEYPPVYLRIGTKAIWPLLATWFEVKKESIAAKRISGP